MKENNIDLQVIESIKLLIEQIQQELTLFVKSTNNEIGTLKQSLQTQEQTIAILVQGYVELVAMVESLVSTLVNQTPEHRNEFRIALQESRKNMISVLQHGIQVAQSFDTEFTPIVSDPSQGSEGNSSS